jgi:small-conductance mechanosensitive channel
MPVEFLTQSFFNNTLAAYGLAIATLVGGFLVIHSVRALVISTLKRISKRSQTTLDSRLIQAFSRPLVRLAYVGIVYIALTNLNLHPILTQVLQSLAVIVTTVIGILFLSQLTEYLVRSYLLKRGDVELENSFSALLPILRSVFWAVGAVFLLDNLGFDISAVVASLGIGGLAIAFAAQGVLQDLFSYFSIVLDRPFSLGDFIIVGDFVGTVEHIGIKTTRLKSIGGEALVIANTDLTGSRIRNFSPMERRRVSFTLGVTYETPKEKLEVIPAIIRDIVARQEQITFDRAHFTSYGDFSLNYDVVYYVESSDYTLAMDVQQRINLALYEAFAQRDIEFAYPTQVTYLQSTQPNQPIPVATVTNSPMG